MRYKQGLSDEFVGALNDLFQSPEGEWWRLMLADPNLFVAIRHNYLNVYFRGCSLAKIEHEQGQVVASTHYKYLLKPKAKPEYVKAKAGVFSLEDHWKNGLNDPFVACLSALGEIKAAARPYAGGEKKLVGDIIKNHTNIVDVEIALTAKDEDTEKLTAQRLDIAALRLSANGPVLEFYEAKLFSNKEIRAQGDAKVVSQMKRYANLLERESDNIRTGLFRSCDNVLKLEGLSPERKKTAYDALAGKDRFKVDPDPYLIVGGFDDDQRKGDIWKEQHDKLVRALGENRVILKGSANSFNLAGGKRPRVIPDSLQ